MNKYYTGCILFLISLQCFAQSEEQKLSAMSKKLHPITDDQWNEVIGSHQHDTYEVQKGDTLWDVSKRLFGNAFYWPKIWSLNNAAAGITNPHIINPGNKLFFVPGTSETLPQVTTQIQNTTQASNTESTPNNTINQEPSIQVASNSNRVPEYTKLPEDKWKPVAPQKLIPKEYDEFGIEKETKIFGIKTFKMRVPAIANETTLPYIGEIYGSRRDGNSFSDQEVVFLKSENQDLQVGTTYSVLSEPYYLDEEKSDRTGYVYKALGEVKVIGIKDGTYIAIITKTYEPLTRGDRIYPLMPSITGIRPVPANDPVEGLVLLNPHESSWGTAQSRFIHLDRGLEDGVQVGNIFRIYEYYDPVTRDKLTESDIMVSADALVVHTTANYCTALIINSLNIVKNGDFAVLLTNISDLEKKYKDKIKDTSGDIDDKELDELDELDHNSDDGIGKKEKEEVKELENWDRNKETQDSGLDSGTSTETQQPPTETPTENAPQETTQSLDSSSGLDSTPAEPVQPLDSTANPDNTPPPPAESSSSELDSGSSLPPPENP